MGNLTSQAAKIKNFLPCCRGNELTDIDGQTPLHRAIKYGNEQKVRNLLRTNANVNARTNDGFTPIHYAVKYGYPKLIRILMSHGADINTVGFHGLTPCHMLMVSRQKMECLEELLKYKPEIEAREILGNTILQIMVMIAPHNMEVILKLLEYGSNPNNLNIVQNNCLHSIAMLDGTVSAYRIRTLATALIKKGLDVNARNRADNTPLHFAAKGNGTLVGVLLEFGADMNAVNKDHFTVFDIAMIHDNEEVLENLIKYVVLREHSGLHVHTSIVQKINSNEKYHRIRSKYEDDMEVLKLMKVEDSSKFSYYNILCCKKVRRKVVRNTYLLNELSYKSIRFSSYKNEIYNLMKKEIDIRNTEEAAYNILSAWWRDELPDLCIKEIASFLDSKDVEYLRTSFDKNSFQYYA